MPADRWRRSLSLTLLAALLGPVSGCAVAPRTRPARQQPAGVGLLEFLGSADPTSHEKQADGGSWMVYLSKLKLDKAAKISGHSPPKTSGAPASSGVPNR